MIYKCVLQSVHEHDFFMVVPHLFYKVTYKIENSKKRQ